MKFTIMLSLRRRHPIILIPKKAPPFPTHQMWQRLDSRVAG
jgi:hypothetical protein